MIDRSVIHNTDSRWRLGELSNVKLRTRRLRWSIRDNGPVGMNGSRLAKADKRI